MFMKIANVVPKRKRPLENLVRHPPDNFRSSVALMLRQPRCYTYGQQASLHDCQSRHAQPCVAIPCVMGDGVPFLAGLPGSALSV